MNTQTIAATPDVAPPRNGLLAKLADPKKSIVGPRVDALLLWGCPLVTLIAFAGYLVLTQSLFPAQSESLGLYALWFSMIITSAHLMAVFPRAYLNKDVFHANRVRLTVVPIALLTALFLSPTFFVFAAIVAFFWDVHHSAMQTFGMSRIYDMKAGNDPTVLRRTDMIANWLLYVGPIFVGASFLVHASELSEFSATPLRTLATWPGYLEAEQGPLRIVAMAVWAVGIAWTVFNYRRAMVERGYKLPAHKIALMSVTGLVTLVAWGYAPPVIAFATINIHHALQYYVIVWKQEGKRITAFSRVNERWAFLLFVTFTAILGVGYQLSVITQSHLLLAPFLACSLLHFWYDGFVWSVRKKTV